MSYAGLDGSGSVDLSGTTAWMKCDGCGHTVSIPTAILFKLLLPLTPLDKAGLRLVCS
jgi:hypothetical protein